MEHNNSEQASADMMQPTHLALARPLNQAQLDDALPYIMAAPKDNAAVSRLCYRTDFSARCFVDTLEFSTEFGVKGDRWHKDAWLKTDDNMPDKRLQVTLLPTRILELVWRESDGDTLIHPGDTMVADLDMSHANLPIGTYLQIGSAVIQVSDYYNGGCKKWRARYGEESFYWFNRADNRDKRLRGILCEIVKDGIVREGDMLKKIKTL